MNVVNWGNKDLISFNIIAGYGILIDLGYYDTDVISRITGDLTYTTLIRNNWTHGATLFDGRGIGATRLIIPTSAPSSPKAGICILTRIHQHFTSTTVRPGSLSH